MKCKVQKELIIFLADHEGPGLEERKGFDIRDRTGSISTAQPTIHQKLHDRIHHREDLPFLRDTVIQTQRAAEDKVFEDP